MPTSNEEAVVCQNDDGELRFQWDVKIYLINDDQPFIDLHILRMNLDPMTYPIYYPKRQPGWTMNLVLPSYPGALSGFRNFNMKLFQTAIRQNEF